MHSRNHNHKNGRRGHRARDLPAEYRGRSERPGDLPFDPDAGGPGRRAGGRRGGPNRGDELRRGDRPHRGERPHRGGGPRGGGYRGRARGDVRAAILLLLAEEPRHGYQLIQEIAERSGGSWKPSPGSVYPTLQVLEDEGLVTIESIDGRKTASLTEAGTDHVAGERESLGSPWDVPAEGGGQTRRQLATVAHTTAEAAQQVGKVGSTEQQTQAIEILERARKDLYRILAEG